MKKLFNNRPWKEWTTRKITLLFTIFAFVIYAIVLIAMNMAGVEVSQLDTLTEQVYSAGKWLVITGCTITIAKTVKGKTNSDKDEIFDDSDESDDTDDDEEAEG